MAEESERYTVFSRRALLLAGLQGAAFTVLGGRLYYLAIEQGEEYRLRADRNRISLRLIAPERGEILDRRGRPLAVNEPDFRVFLVPEQTTDVEATLAKLQRIISLSESRVNRILRTVKKQRSFVPVTVAEHLDWATFSKVNVALPDLPGVIPDAGLTRFYPEGPNFAHSVGYLGSPGEEDIRSSPLYQLPGFKLGREGLENRYESDLRGAAGRRQVEVNSVGRVIRELPDRQDATAGNQLQTTLDLDLQRFAMEQLKEEAAGVVVVDVRNGDIKALANTPAFDPNEFTQGISQQNWSALLADPRNPLLNKCLSAQVPPGSTFKMVVALAALEDGLITDVTRKYCNGRHPFGDNVFNCWKRGGHGDMALVEALGQSCDVYFYELAERLGVDKIADMAHRFGLGEAHEIGLDGVKEGLVPTERWKFVTQELPWYQGETLNVSIGQGALLATPLQLAVMTSRIATGLRVQPRLVADNTESGPFFDVMDVNPVHLDLMRQGMARVTAPGGTAHDYRRRKSAPTQAGKTGTAQVRRITAEERAAGVIDNEDLPWQRRDHALYVGYTTLENPTHAVAVLVEHGGGGAKVAAPIGRAVLDEALRLDRLSDTSVNAEMLRNNPATFGELS